MNRPAQDEEAGNNATPLTFPMTLHFLQQEWGRFERERLLWQQERADLQVGHDLCLSTHFTRLVLATLRASAREKPTLSVTCFGESRCWNMLYAGSGECD